MRLTSTFIAMMLKQMAVSLSPLGILMLCIALASALGYAALLLLGDVLPIERVVNKGTQVLLVFSLFPLTSLLHLQWTELGFTSRTLFIRQFSQGFGIGLSILLPLIAVLYLLDVRELKTDKIWSLLFFFKILFGSFLSATLISCLEEPVFRGLLLAALKKKMTMITAVFVGSAYYAVLHFLKTDLDVPYEQLSWANIVYLIEDALLNPFHWEHLQAFIALYMVGVFLAVARLYAGLSLAFCIGCHTGWVFLIKLSKSVTNLNIHSDYFFLVSHYDGVIGPMASVWLFLAILCYFLVLQKKAQ